MFIDLTLAIDQEMVLQAERHEKKAFDGHLGTHFDVMNKHFPLEYVERDAIVFDVSQIKDRDIDIDDIDLTHVKAHQFVAFYTGFIDRIHYGTTPYFKEHPQLSHALIDCLLDKKISIIGIDFAGMRRGVEHTPKDQYCADRGIFVVENLCGLQSVLQDKTHHFFIAHTYPIHYTYLTGLPCRVVAEL